MNCYDCTAGKRILAILVAACVLLTGFSLSPQVAAAAGFDPGANGTRHVRQEDPALIIFAKDGKNGDGFCGNYRYLTQSQLESIGSEAAADLYFSSASRETYLKDKTYSARTKAEKGGWDLYTISGLDLLAVADSLGVNTNQDVNVLTKGRDGHSSQISSAFTEKLYSFPSENSSDSDGVQVYPVIATALKTKDGSNLTSELPRFVFGQSTAGDYNMQNWEKWLKYVWIGEKQNIFSLNLNGQNKSYSLADIIGTKSGSYTSEYQYTDNGKQQSVTATGVPLDQFLKDAGMSGNNTIKTSGGKVISDPSKYFLAYGARDSGAGTVKSSGQLILYGPGTTRQEVVTERLDSLSVSVAAPAAASGLKAAQNRYNQIKLTWSRAAGAQGYNIYRYNKAKKNYQLLNSVEGISKTSYMDTGLKTGAKYTYKVKAYRTVGSLDLESAFSNAASATPRLTKTKVKLSKSGKKSIKVKWSKVAGANGYQVRIGRNKKVTKGKKTYTIKKGTIVSKKIKKLKKGKRCYVKVRAYRKVSGKKVYGAYSSVKSIRR